MAIEILTQDQLFTSSVTAMRLYTTDLYAVSSVVDVFNITQYELSGYDITGDVNINGGHLSVSENAYLSGNTYIVGNTEIYGNTEIDGNTTLGNANTDETTIRGYVKIADSSVTTGILFGLNNTDYDVALYRGAVGTLRTNGNLWVDQDFKTFRNTTLGDGNTDETIIRGIVKVADSTATNGILLGSSDTNYDTNIYRSAQNTLKTDDNLTVALALNVEGNTTLGNASTDENIIRGITKIADSSATNGILLGSNNTSYDTNLYRSTTDLLKTDDDFEIGRGGGKTTLRLTSTSTDTGLTIGTDTNLYRSTNDLLKTDDNFEIGSNGGKTTLNLSNTNANVGITIGGDVNMYRASSSLLKTDDSFEIGIAGGKTTLRLTSTDTDTGITLGGDTNLYRSAQNTLKTDDNFVCDSSVTLGSDDADTVTIKAGPVTLENADDNTNGLEFGTSDKPILYKSAANVLTLQGTFYSTNIPSSNTANTVFAAPNGTAGAGSFRTLVAADIPVLDTSKITSGTLGVARGGTGRSTFTSGSVLVGNGVNGINSVAGLTTTVTVLTSVGGGTSTMTFTNGVLTQVVGP